MALRARLNQFTAGENKKSVPCMLAWECFLYQEVTALHNNWENGHFYLGKYYDKLMVNCADGDEKSNKLSV